MTKKRPNAYICFLDLLGVEYFASRSYETFYDILFEFEQALVNNAVPLGEEGGQVFHFSNSAYIECRNLSRLLDYVAAIRSHLLAKGYFFQGAIGRGQLEPSIRQPDEEGSETVTGVRFGENVAEVFGAQSTLRGIGIRLLPEIVGDVRGGRAVANCHLPQSSSRVPETFFDLRLDRESDLKPLVLKVFTQHFYAWSRISKRVARKYIPFLICCIQSADFRGAKADDRETMPPVYLLMRSGGFLRQIASVPGIEYAYFCLLNKVLGECKDPDLRRATMDLIAGRRRHVENLQSVPRSLLSEHHRHLFVERLKERLGQDVDDVFPFDDLN